MLLRNYDNIMASYKLPNIATGTSGVYLSTDASVFGDGHINVISYDGKIAKFPYSEEYMIRPFLFRNFPNTYTPSDAWGMGFSNLICGSGDTAPTYDDYKLGDIITGLDCIKNSCGVYVYDENSKSWSREYKKTYYNSNEFPVTVREIGVIYMVRYNGWDRNALIYRKVLDTPVEVPAEANFIISFTPKVSANPNKPVDYDVSAVVVE